MNMEAKGKWECKSCGVPIPYNPTYDMSDVMCSHCMAHHYAAKYLGGYSWSQFKKTKTKQQ